ncbi:MAG: hypothetical protein WBB74_13015 [Gaiellaceae bacterium]
MTVAAPAIVHVGSHFLARSAVGLGEAAPGDHLQTGYRLWLFGHQLEHGHAPWLDPYSFQPEASPTVNFAAWPFAIPYWPLEAVGGPVIAWNVFVLLSYVLAGAFACAWLRELGLPRAAALAGGLAFAIAPYRTAQSLGHLLGPISMLIPLSLYALERARRGSEWWLVLAGAALASIPLSGQVHVALAAIPFFLAYAAIRLRGRPLWGALAGVVVAVVAGLLVQRVAIAGSVGSEGRTLHDVHRYQAQWADFVARNRRHGTESFVFLGWLTPLMGVAGLVLLVRARRRALALLLGVGVVVPALLALGTNLPLYTALWHAFPPLRYPRVPERLMPIACLSLAALVAFAVARLPRIVLPMLVVAALFGDLESHLYLAAPADRANAAYTAVSDPGSGRLLELPVYRPDVHYGSIYVYYDMQALRQRPAGYSTLAPKAVDPVIRRLEPLNCGAWTRGTSALLDRLGVRYVAVHGGIFAASTLVPDTSWFAERALVRHGFRPLAHHGVLTAFVRGGWHGATPGQEPPRDWIAFCQGWYSSIADDGGRPMREPLARLWVYGTGRLALRLTAAHELEARFAVDGRTQLRVGAGRPARIALELGPRRWHLVEVRVSHMVRTPKRPEQSSRREGLRVLPLTSPSNH